MPVKRFTPLFLALLMACGSTCQQDKGDSPADAAASSEPRIELPGVDTTQLTPREHGTWSSYVQDVLAPCPEVAVPVAQCVREKRDCATCLPAAKFLLRLVQAGKPREEVNELFTARFDPKAVKT